MTYPWVVALTARQPAQFVVTRDAQVGCVCQLAANQWHPLFGVRTGGHKFELSKDFVLPREAEEALDLFVVKHHLRSR